MEGQAFFTTIAGLGVSIAGFAGLIAALRSRDNWTDIDTWRFRAIIGYGFQAALLALIPIPVFTFTGDEGLTVRIASGCLAAAALLEMVSLKRAPSMMWPEGKTWDYVFGVVLFVAPQLINVVWGQLGLFQVGLLAHLVHPANVFLNVVHDRGPKSII